MAIHVGRNDPCPCGSGRKYKHCCEGKLQLASRIRRGGPWVYVGLAVAAVAIAGIVFALRGQSRATIPGSAPGSISPVGGGNTAGPPAAPWTYDPATNRHFDPGHNHWHDGPPPSAGQRDTAGISSAPTAAPAESLAAIPGPTPAAWTYDPVKNQYWDPNHGHWHPGQPPTTRK